MKKKEKTFTMTINPPKEKPKCITHGCSSVLIDPETGKQYDMETGEEIIKIK